MRRMMWVAGVLVAFVLAMQLKHPDFDRRTVNEAATIDARLHPPTEVQGLLHGSCYNCHSDQGETPWYGRTWPGSQLLQDDVRHGRARLNFSEWDRLSPEMSRIRLLDACRMMREEKMPVWYYRPMHPETGTPKAEDVAAFCTWAEGQPKGAPELRASGQ